jgi:hypothetical protein
MALPAARSAPLHYDVNVAEIAARLALKVRGQTIFGSDLDLRKE